MTRNQLMYWELQENKRANRAKEMLTDFANVTGRSDVENKFTLGTEGNVIQARNVGNQFMLGNMQQESNRKQAEAALQQAMAGMRTSLANESQAATAAARLPIYQMEADLKAKEVDIKNAQLSIDRQKLDILNRQTDINQFMSESDRAKAVASVDQAKAALKNAETNLKDMEADYNIGWNNMIIRKWEAESNFNAKKVDVESAARRRADQTELDWYEGVRKWIDMIIPFS